MNKKAKEKVLKRFYNCKTQVLLYLFCFIFASSSLSYLFLHSVESASVIYTENFTTSTYQDVNATTGKWDIALGQAKLLGKDFVNMAGTSSQPDNISNNSGSSLGQDMQIEEILGYENISDNSGWSRTQQFVLDSANNPYLVWFDQTSGNNVFFTRWTPGLGWTKMNGSAGFDIISNTSSVSSVPQIKLDSSGNPYLVWTNATGSGDIIFTKWTPSTGWTKMDGTLGYDNISNNPTSSNYPQFSIDSADNPYVVWSDGAKKDVYFSKWTVNPVACAPNPACWTKMDSLALDYEVISNTTVGSFGAESMQIILDTANKPYVVWQEYATIDTNGISHIMFTHWDGAQWAKMDTTAGFENISNNAAGWTRGPRLLLDAVNNPYISWYSNVVLPVQVYLTRWSAGAWSKMDGTPGIDNPTLGNAGAEDFMRFDAAGTLYVSWNNFDIFLTYWDGLKWAKLSNGALGADNLSNTGVAGGATTQSFEIDSANNPHVVWQDNTTGTKDIYFTKFTPGTGWTKMDGVTLGYDNLSNNSGSSLNAQIKLDAANKPYVVWYDVTTGAGDIYITKWSPGIGWTRLSNTDNPYIVWNDDTTGNQDIYFKKWKPGTGWTNMNGAIGFDNISNNSGNSSSQQMELDYSYFPNVVWSDDTTGSGDIYFKKWTPGAGWTQMNGASGYDNLSNNAGVSQNQRFQLDSNNNPYVVWQDATTGNGDIYFTRWKPGSGWVNMSGTAGLDNLSNNAGGSGYPEIQLDSNNNPYVVWQDGTTGNGDVYFTHWDGAKWAKMNGVAGFDNVSNTSGASNPTHMLLDGNNNPNVVWFDQTSGNQEIYFSKWTPAANAWTKMDGTAGFDNISNSSGTSHPTGMQLDSANNPYVVWDDTTTGLVDIYFSKWTPAAGAWTKMDGTAGFDNVSNNAGTSRESQLQIDSSGNPYVIWEDNTGFIDNEIVISKWTPAAGAWTKMDEVSLGYNNVTNFGTNIAGFMLKINGADIPYLTWSHNLIGNNEVYFAKLMPVYKTSSIIQSLNVNPNGQPVTAATLNAMETLNGQTINYFLSNDGGATWEPVAKGVEFTFFSNGADLRWQANLQTSNINITPIINSLVIDYVTPAAVVVGGGNPPSAPFNLTCQAQDANLINWNFEDTASNETGFRLYGPQGFILDTGNENAADLSHLDEINLAVNTLYNDRQVTAFNSSGESSLSNAASCFTLANTPLELEILAVTESSLTIKINPADNNPSITEYAIKELNSNQYINPDGTFSRVENWQTYANWGGDNGVIVSGEPLLPVNETLNSNYNIAAQFKISLLSGTIYNFAVKARNGDGIETALSSSTSGDTETPPAPPSPPPSPPLPPVPPTPPVTPPIPPTPPVVPPTPPITPPVTPPPPVAPPVTPSVVLPTTALPTTVSDLIMKDFVDNPQVKKFSLNIIIPLLLLIALLNTIPTILAIVLNILPYLHLLFIEPLIYLFRKKREKWGVVYDALSKLPVDLAVIRLYSKADNKLVQTRISDKNGRYLMIAKEPGKYYLSVTRPGYLYPTKYLKDEKQDIKYLDLYHGEVLEVKGKEGVITVNIPLDPTEKKLLPVKQVIFNYIISNIRLIVSYTGIILALFIVLIYPGIFTIGALILHLILFLIFRRLVVPPKPKSWGIVYDQTNKKPLHYAIIRIFETKFNKLLETQVTDSKGRYAFLVGKNIYQLLTEKEGYEKKEVKPVDLVKKEAIINLDISLGKNNKLLSSK